MKPDFPLVSVLMPLYNKEAHVAEAIKSVLNQTYLNIELIVIDDGSTDGSIDEVHRFVSDKVRLFKQENKGVSSARNVAFDYSKGDYIQYLDADDVLDNRKIEEQVNILMEYSETVGTDRNGFVLATAKRFYFQNKVDKIWQPEAVLNVEKDYDNMYDFLLDDARNSILLHSWLIPRAIIQKAGKWDETMTIFEDRDFYLRLVPLASKIIYCQNAICFYRVPTIEHHIKRNKKTDFETVLRYFSTFEAHFLLENNTLSNESRFVLACLHKKLLNIADDKTIIEELVSRSERLGLAPNCGKSRFIRICEKMIGIKNTFWLVYLKSKYIDTF